MDFRDYFREQRKDKSFRRAEYNLQWDIGFNIGNELSNARMNSDLTQAQLAKRIKTKQSGIARAERGRVSSLIFLNKCAKAMRCKLDIRFVKVPTFAETEKYNTNSLDSETITRPVSLSLTK